MILIHNVGFYILLSIGVAIIALSWKLVYRKYDEAIAKLRDYIDGKITLTDEEFWTYYDRIR